MDSELITKVVQKIFPAGSEIIKNPLEVPPEDRFWLIPGRNGPRWLIPQKRKYGLSVFQQWRPYKLASCIKWKVLYGAYYTGRLGLMPEVKSIGIASDSKKKWKHFNWDNESAPIPLIYFGTPCKKHKAVAILVDSTKLQPCKIGKLPLSELAAESIKREYNNLCYLKKNNPRIAPSPIFLDNESGVSVQEAIIGSPMSREFSGQHWRLLEQLDSSNNTTSVFEQSQRLLILLSETDRLNLKTKILLEKLLKECKDTTSLPQIFIHGDFAPWNIIKIESGSLIALDWEMGNSKGIPLYDFFYFSLIQSYLFNDNFSDKRFLKYLPNYIKKYPINQIRKITLTSLVLNLTKDQDEPDNFDKFIKNKT